MLGVAIRQWSEDVVLFITRMSGSARGTTATARDVVTPICRTTTQETAPERTQSFFNGERYINVL